MKLTQRQKTNWKWLIAEMGKKSGIPYLHLVVETNYDKASVSGANLLSLLFLTGFYNPIDKSFLTPDIHDHYITIIKNDFGDECFPTVFNKYSLFMQWLQNRIPSFDIDQASLTPAIAKLLQEYMERYDDAVNGTVHTATIPAPPMEIETVKFIITIDDNKFHFPTEESVKSFFKSNPHIVKKVTNAEHIYRVPEIIKKVKTDYIKLDDIIK